MEDEIIASNKYALVIRCWLNVFVMLQHKLVVSSIMGY